MPVSNPRSCGAIERRGADKCRHQCGTLQVQQVHVRVFPSRNRISLSSSCELAKDRLRGNCGGVAAAQGLAGPVRRLNHLRVGWGSLRCREELERMRADGGEERLDKRLDGDFEHLRSGSSSPNPTGPALTGGGLWQFWQDGPRKGPQGDHDMTEWCNCVGRNGQSTHSSSGHWH